MSKLDMPTDSERREIDRINARLQAQSEIEEAVKTIYRHLNVTGSDRESMVGEALASEHPTLVGQLAKGFGEALVKRFGEYPDGRIAESTVEGARLLMKQPFI